MAKGRYFKVNSPPVVLETVDEETIIVNLDSGSYYDLNHSGGHVLHTLAAGADVESAADQLATRYSVARDDVAGPVGKLAAELVSEGILLAMKEPGNAAPSAANGDAPARKYEEPALTKFTDMQELLLLDPVHDVDEAGWPKPA